MNGLRADFATAELHKSELLRHPMFTSNSYLVIVMADAHRADLLQEAATARAALGCQKEARLRTTELPPSTSPLTWRHSLQKLFTDVGLILR